MSIRILETQVANQIAAGEVVERPLSVIKELIENSMDAGATQIDVSVGEGGLLHLIVQDNGCGMSPEDAVLCFSRHATSKIQTASDLESIASFGFRGEALAAIASVSEIQLTSKRQEDPEAFGVHLRAGSLLEAGPTKGQAGTRIEVYDLFYNTPARRKFLKTPAHEYALIENLIKSLAMVHTNIGFSLRKDQQSKLDLRPSSAHSIADPVLLERTLECLSSGCRGQIFAIDAATELVRMRGFVASPLVNRNDTKEMRLFVNGRFVQDRLLNQAVLVAYRTLLEVGRKPICTLNFEVDSASVDVNVHPQKLELRFAEPSRVQSHIIRLLSDFLATTPWLKAAPAKTYELRSESSSAPYVLQRPSAPEVFVSSEPVFRQLPQLPMEQTFQKLRILGQVDATFLVLDDGEALVLLDQHAAHERVLFERLKEQVKHKTVPSQALLFPRQIALSSAEAALLSTAGSMLSDAGFQIDWFGESVALMRQIPMHLDEQAAESLLRDFLSDLDSDKTQTAFDDWIEKACAQIACHGSVRAGQVLDHAEIAALLKQLDHIDYQAHCPHGRPTARRMPYIELAKWFHRL